MFVYQGLYAIDDLNKNLFSKLGLVIKLKKQVVYPEFATS